MYKVLRNEKISPNSYIMEIEAKDIINKALPGQFVILMTKEDSERIPLTIYDMDKKKGTVSVIYQVIGASTEEMTKIKDELFAITGPLGKPNEMCAEPEKYKGSIGDVCEDISLKTFF